MVWTASQLAKLELEECTYYYEALLRWADLNIDGV